MPRTGFGAVWPWADVNVADDITLTNITQITNRSYADLQDKPYIPTEADIDTNAMEIDTNTNTECDGNTVLTGLGLCQSITDFHIQGGTGGTVTLDVNADERAVLFAYDLNYAKDSDFNKKYISIFDSNGINGQYVGSTTVSFKPNLSFGGATGYIAANKLCDLNYPNSHICTVQEMIQSIRLVKVGVAWAGTSWAAGGNPGYTANANDCAGYTTSDTTPLGSFWNFDANKSSLTSCSGSKPLACCRMGG